MPSGSDMRAFTNRQTDGQTDGINFITSTAKEGGNDFK